MFENYKEALTELPYYMVLVVGLCAVIWGLMRMVLNTPPPIPPPPRGGYKWFRTPPKPPLMRQKHPENHIDHPPKTAPKPKHGTPQSPSQSRG